MAKVLILPGLHNSGPSHWQSLWLAAHPEYRRVVQEDWTRPRSEDWIRVLDEAVLAAGKEVPVLVAHSTACALVGHWWVRHKRRIRGALLVAPSDTQARSYPRGPQGFAPMPLNVLPFPTIVVASRNDPAVSFSRARFFAECWGSELIDLGVAGHINEKSGYGPWPDAHKLVERLLLQPVIGKSDEPKV